MAELTTNLNEGALLRGESGKHYLVVSPLGQDNVWTAVEKDSSTVVVIKSPSPDDDARLGWPKFQHEMIMHELFKDNSDHVRRQVDRIIPNRRESMGGRPPMLVLEIMETTVWTARTKRPFTVAELRTVAKGTLEGLRDVHAKGLVYADMKMQNIMLNGFDVNKPSANSEATLVTKLGDLGIVMYPSMGKVQPVAYRAPEVFFRGEITRSVDIWSWGLIYCHLLEAQRRFSKTGLYDDLNTGGGTMPEREQAMKYAIANDYDIGNVAYYKNCALPHRDQGHAEGNQWEELRKRGLKEGHIQFLQWVLNPDPRARPSAQDILDHGWLDKDGDEDGVSFTVKEALASGVTGGAAPPPPETATATQLKEEVSTAQTNAGAIAEDVKHRPFSGIYIDYRTGSLVGANAATDTAKSTAVDKTLAQQTSEYPEQPDEKLYGLLPSDYPPVVRRISRSPSPMERRPATEPVRPVKPEQKRTISHLEPDDSSRRQGHGVPEMRGSRAATAQAASDETEQSDQAETASGVSRPLFPRNPTGDGLASETAGRPNLPQRGSSTYLSYR